MKRIFLHIGITSVVTMLVLCLSSIKIVICFTVGLAVLFIASLCLRYYRENVSVPLCFGSALLSCVIFLLTMLFVVSPQLDLSGEEHDISFYIVEQQSVNDDGDYVYVARTTSISDSSSQRIKFRLKSPAPIQADYYSIVNAKVNFYAISDTPFSSFGYWSDNIYLTAVCDVSNPTNDKKWSPMLHVLHLRDEIKNAFDLMLGDNVGGLATALVTGDKSGIDEQIKSYFRFAGASHIMVVSGLHLTVVAGTLFLLLRKLKVSNFVITPTVLLSILFYCALAGFSKSVIRAGVMMSIMVIAPMLKNHADSLNSLGLALFLICLNPFAVTDVGALLSILATFALIFASDISRQRATMDNNLSEKAFLRVKNRVLAIYFSVFVILFTLPVLFFTYGAVSIGSIVSNVLIVPFGGVAVVMSVLTFVFYKLGINIITAVFANATKYILQCIINIVKWIASYSGTMITLDKYFGVILAGALLIIAVCFIYKNGVLLKKGIAVSLAFVLVASAVACIYTRDYSYLYVTPNGAVVLDSDDEIIVVGVDSYGDYCSVRSYLSSKNETIDVLVANGDDKYSAMLTQTVPTNVVLTDELSDYMLNVGHYNEIVLKNEYTISLDDVKVDFYYGECKMLVDDISIVFTNKSYIDADIVVDYKTDFVTDNNGRIKLSDGDTLYSICGDSFSARRMY